MTFALRCVCCLHALGRSAESPVRLVGYVKAGTDARIDPVDDEIRRRCRHCGTVHVFAPLAESAAVA